MSRAGGRQSSRRWLWWGRCSLLSLAAALVGGSAVHGVTDGARWRGRRELRTVTVDTRDNGNPGDCDEPGKCSLSAALRMASPGTTLTIELTVDSLDVPGALLPGDATVVIVNKKTVVTTHSGDAMLAEITGRIYNPPPPPPPPPFNSRCTELSFLYIAVIQRSRLSKELT
eukprot:SAG31_NODE_2424_length_5724_cov_35.068978_6_plen_171_part_00